MEEYYDRFIIELREWAESYTRASQKFIGDTHLKFDKNKKIYIALDWYDLYDHCFPSTKTLLDYKNPKERDQYLNRISARYALFYLYKNLYNYPLLILPPHFMEMTAFYKKYDRKIKKTLMSKERIEEIREYIIDIISKYENSTDSYVDFLLEFEKNAPDLAFLFSPCFYSGISGLRRLFNKEIVSPDLGKIGLNHFKTISEIESKNNVDLEMFANKWRKDLTINNKRDAKALQYLVELNKILGQDAILILVSSEKLFNTYKYERDDIFRVEIEHEGYPLIRNTKSFYIALIELIAIFAENKNNKIDNPGRSEFEMISQNVSKDLITLKEFQGFTESATFLALSGLFKDKMDDLIINLTKLRNKAEQRERTALLILINEIYPLDKSLKNILAYTQDDLGIFLNDLKQQLEKEEFLKILLRRIIDFQIQRASLEKELATIDMNGTDQFGKYKNFAKIFICRLDSRPKLNLEYLETIFSRNMIPFPEGAKLIPIKYNLEFGLFSNKQKNDILYFIIKNDRKVWELYKIQPTHIYLLLSILIEKIENGVLDERDLDNDPILSAVNRELIPLIVNTKIDFYYKNEIISLFDQIVSKCEFSGFYAL